MPTVYVKVGLNEEQSKLLDKDRGVIPRATFLLDFWLRHRVGLKPRALPETTAPKQQAK